MTQELFHRIINESVIRDYLTFVGNSQIFTRDRKFELLYNTEGSFDLKLVSSNINNVQVQKYLQVNRKQFGGDFRQLTFQNLEELLIFLYNE